MNYLAQMLSTGPTLTSKQVKSSTTVRKADTPEARAKLRATVQKKRRAKWRAYFAQFPDMTATTTQLSNACGLRRPLQFHLLNAQVLVVATDGGVAALLRDFTDAVEDHLADVHPRRIK